MIDFFKDADGDESGMIHFKEANRIIDANCDLEDHYLITIDLNKKRVHCAACKSEHGRIYGHLQDPICDPCYDDFLEWTREKRKAKDD